jgi:hypothetical protein
MSHIHNLGGPYNAAAEYQAFLEQLKSSRQTEREEHVRGKTRIPNSEEEPVEDRPDEGERETDEEPPAEPEDNASGGFRPSYA